ncbi:hypothetical protein DC415_23925 [Agrobacterium tumefaciens]|uniref:Uncharacterized protein n=1 Tax=Rhizobium rhizogenes TaxID=359 RepID=A0AA92BYY2_RHIRH|nr:hypothetical protein DC430_23535 [Rhizobium rhizogenes]PVE62000.1 hypothetical protein DC415_23925 [Agrobacterium tumefaciens]PVE69764.1 hypothetical protein DCP16_23925 [Sphingomonas sp. TPD3009]
MIWLFFELFQVLCTMFFLGSFLVILLAGKILLGVVLLVSRAFLERGTNPDQLHSDALGRKTVFRPD